MIGGQLERVVPQRAFARAQLLNFFPGDDAHIGPDLGEDFFVNCGGLPGHRGMLAGVVGHYHLMIAVGMLEEIVNSLFLHQAAGEIEIGLAVLDDVIALIIGSGDVVADVESDEHQFKNVGHGEVLKNAAADFFRQQPELGDYFGAEVHEGFIAAALTKAFDDAVEIALAVVEQAHLHGHALTDDLVEADFVFLVGDHIDVEAEKMRDLLVALKSSQKEDVWAQGRGDLEWPIGLRV